MRLLLVDGNPDGRDLLRLAARESGFALDTAMGETDGLSLAAEAEYDAIVWHRPISGGIEFVHRLRRTKATPLLVVAAGVTAKARAETLDAGADDCLCPPVETIELLARLRALIRRRFGLSHSALTFGSIVLHTDARIVTRHGKEVQLTKREYDILEYLALRRPRVISRNLLQTQLHDFDRPSSNAVDVHIFSLRRKFGQGVIGTRRGQGFFFRPD